MKKGTLISLVIALIAIAGALLGLVAYMRSRRCLECGDTEEDDTPEADGGYDMEYYVDQPVSVDDAPQGDSTVPRAAESAPAGDTESDDFTE